MDFSNSDKLITYPEPLLINIRYSGKDDISQQYVDIISYLLDINSNISISNDKLSFLCSQYHDFRLLYTLLKKVGECALVIEDYYVDRIYRDSYYSYYSGKHFPYNRDCRRLSIFSKPMNGSFFDQPKEVLSENFIGTIVIRPIRNKAIGRTLINPFYVNSLKNIYVRLAKYDITIAGIKLEVDAFPYSMQDGETTSCAEITIINLTDYYSRRYPEYRYILPSELISIVQKESYERCLPTTGLRYALVTKILSEVGFYPRLYSSHDMDELKFRHIMHYYIESGIPVALGLKNGNARHSVICIGHGEINNDASLSPIYTPVFMKKNETDTLSGLKYYWFSDTADLINSYCIMDDNNLPYTLCTCSTNNDSLQLSEPLVGEIENFVEYEIEYLLVPLYKKMYLDAEYAYDNFVAILADETLGIKQFIYSTHEINLTYRLADVGTECFPLIIRIFMASSKTFSRVRNDDFRNNNPIARRIYATTPLPRFIWVCELYTAETYVKRKAIGEIILDGTASRSSRLDGCILIHYPGMIHVNTSSANTVQNEAYTFYKMQPWTAFSSYSRNLYNK